jgi:CHAT domain-containing protein
MHRLGPSANTRTEVQTIGRQLGATPGEIILGEQFTVARLIGEDLTPYRIIHLATHALLPTELGQCQTDPTILTSVPRNAPSASAGFLGLDSIEKLKIDADLVVLSACDTAGPSRGAGESLSGLAQAFFRAGTRGMLVTQWAAADVAAMRLMTAILSPGAGGGAGDTALALREAQLHMIDTAGSATDMPMQMSHPYAWAPFVLIGDGVHPRASGGQISALR